MTPKPPRRRLALTLRRRRRAISRTAVTSNAPNARFRAEPSSGRPVSGPTRQRADSSASGGRQRRITVRRAISPWAQPVLLAERPREVLGRRETAFVGHLLDLAGA